MPVYSLDCYCSLVFLTPGSYLVLLFFCSSFLPFSPSSVLLFSLTLNLFQTLIFSHHFQTTSCFQLNSCMFPAQFMHVSISIHALLLLCNGMVPFLSQGSALLKRVRYCKSCKAYIKGFDHHCPAFGNCIGQNNYVLFMILLAGFLTTEASYIVCSSQFSRGSQILGGTWFEGVFFTWHLYCICFNIRTDEWINWKKYPEFQFVIQSQPGESFTRVMFKNPYDNGYLQNVKEFLSLRGCYPSQSPWPLARNLNGLDLVAFS
ncbi:hypothetical protein NC652_022804 [Populus alba x Populus x berolinensis]|nr:hypothetical protein NC652_022804 [Populus alba x Populus x berolinensis]